MNKETNTRFELDSKDKLIDVLHSKLALKISSNWHKYVIASHFNINKLRIRRSIYICCCIFCKRSIVHLHPMWSKIDCLSYCNYYLFHWLYIRWGHDGTQSTLKMHFISWYNLKSFCGILSDMCILELGP